MAHEGGSGLLPIPCCSGKHESAQHLQASAVQAMASGSQSSQPACRGELAAINSAAGTLDPFPSGSASLSPSSLCREASEVGAVCVNAPVRIRAGGDQRWSSLPRHWLPETDTTSILSKSRFQVTGFPAPDCRLPVVRREKKTAIGGGSRCGFGNGIGSPDGE